MILFICIYGLSEDITKYLLTDLNETYNIQRLSVIRQKGESQNPRRHRKYDI